MRARVAHAAWCVAHGAWSIVGAEYFACDGYAVVHTLCVTERLQHRMRGRMGGMGGSDGWQDYRYTAVASAA